MDALTFIPTRAAFGDGPLAAHAPLNGRTPRQLLMRLMPCRRPFLLESGKGGELGRWSFLGGGPRLVLACGPSGVTLTENGATLPLAGGPLTALRRVLRENGVSGPGGADTSALPPFFAGLCGVFSYDLARRFERLPALAADDAPVPEADLGWYDTVIAVDHHQARLWVCHLPAPAERSAHAAPRHDRARGRIVDLFERLDTPAPGEDAPPATAPVGAVAAEMPRAAFLDMVRRAKDYIAAGDIFQANLSQRFAAPLNGLHPWELYRALAAINPAPFACYLEQDGRHVVSSSPERLVSLRAGLVQARPIAGTRPRGADAALDRLSGQELLAHPKERAEHVMLVDLMRNDLGRVCDYGSVRVSEFMTTERYSHVIHIVSNVVGRLGPGMDAPALLKAVFPGGTITGAPKVRCMEIIEELEPVRRGIYTGSAGYLSAAGDMDLNILIRTIHARDGMARFQTGAGIVADSDPEAEYEETLHKAAAMRRALEQAADGAVRAAGGRPVVLGTAGG
ncbi:MAG: aminodeoxychorismate synthase, component I [Nitrospirae bacterium]|nr:aminodeoxychorismate synthase, component I [Nitrospirota bacterium]